jgi:hypothetical protein
VFCCRKDAQHILKFDKTIVCTRHLSHGAALLSNPEFLPFRPGLAISVALGFDMAHLS